MGDYATMQWGGIPATVLTVEAWVRLNSIADQTIVEFQHMDGWSLGVESGQAQFRVTTFGDAQAVLGGPVPTHRWVHLAGTCDGDTFRIYVDGIFRAKGTITRDSGPFMDSMVMIGCTWDPMRPPTDPCSGDYFDGVLDELIIHHEVKSDDYIYNRAHPGVPMVRYLASTGDVSDGGAYPYRGYRLHWDSAAADAVRPWVPSLGGGDPCLGLLSPCNGYEGWWRLDELGDDVVDSSTWRRHGTADLTLAPTQGLDLAGRDFESGDAVIRLPGAAADGLVEFTLETTSYIESDDSVFWWWSAANATENRELEAAGEWVADWLPWLAIAGASHGLSVDPILDQWSHTALTRLADGTAQLKLDYSIVSTVSTSGAGFSCPGGECSPVSMFADNAVDSFRIMNRVLPSDELLHFPRAAWMLDDPVSSSICIPAPLGGGEGCTDDVECESADCAAGFCTAP
jgi:hypothetical protein